MPYAKANLYGALGPTRSPSWFKARPCFGFGVPNLSQLLSSANTSLTLVAQGSIKPFDKEGSHWLHVWGYFPSPHKFYFAAVIGAVVVVWLWRGR
jgi:hypothetical protein